jgi:hypothetical protein
MFKTSSTVIARLAVCWDSPDAAVNNSAANTERDRLIMVDPCLRACDFRLGSTDGKWILSNSGHRLKLAGKVMGNPGGVQNVQRLHVRSRRSVRIRSTIATCEVRY